MIPRVSTFAYKGKKFEQANTEGVYNCRTPRPIRIVKCLVSSWSTQLASHELKSEVARTDRQALKDPARGMALGLFHSALLFTLFDLEKACCSAVKLLDYVCDHL